MNIAIASACITLILALLAATWKFATIATKLAEDSRQMRERIAALDKGLEHLDAIPLLSMRIGQLEQIATVIPQMKDQILMLARDMKSIVPPRPRHNSGNFDHE